MPRLKNMQTGQRFRDADGDEGVVVGQVENAPTPATLVRYDDPEMGACTEHGNDEVELLDPTMPTGKELVDKLVMAKSDEADDEAVQAIRARLDASTSTQELSELGIALLDLVIDLISGAP